MTSTSSLQRLRDDHWALGAMAISAALSTVFITRSAVTVAGQRAYTLVDDAMISMVYARNLARGDGLVYNAGGEAVEGITNPLWAFVMALVHLVVPGDRFPALAVMLIGAAILVGCVALVWRITRHIEPGAIVAARAAALGAALLYPLVYWTLRGMETGLVTLLTLALVDRVLMADAANDMSGRDLAWLAGLSFAAVWTRLDMAFVMGGIVLWVGLATSNRKRTRLLCAIVAGTGAGGFTQLGARLAYYGEVLPTTYTLKVAHTPLSVRVNRGLAVALRQAQTGLAPVLPAMLAAPFVAAPHRRRLALPLTVSTVLAAYMIQTGGDAWEWMGYADRFLVPALALAFPVVALVGHHLLERRVASVLVLAALGTLALGLVPLDLDLIQYGTTDGRGSQDAVQWGMLGLAAVAVAGLGRSFLDRNGRSPHEPPPPLAPLVVAAAMVAATSLPGLLFWARDNAVDLSTDAAMANYGRYLADVLEPEATIATVFAGAPKYFSDLPAIDLLGKNDKVIADLEPQDVTFHPGHTKWDYDYSILQLRPDAVIRLWRFGGEFLPVMLDAGWVEVEPVDDDLRSLWEAARSQRVWVRRDSAHVRWQAVTERTR